MVTKKMKTEEIVEAMLNSQVMGKLSQRVRAVLAMDKAPS